MSEPRFTKGPWRVGECGWSPDGSAYYSLSGQKEISFPNGFLIAAAPDLYEALLNARKFLPPAIGICNLVDAALAKARGEIK
jgi:hypothetical protein